MTPRAPALRVLLALTVFAFARVALADDAKEAAASERPKDAVVLFDGKDLSKWQKRGGGEPGFKVEDGAMVVKGGDIETKDKFGDFKLHVEFAPNDVGPSGPGKTGQARGNSGVYLQNRYELQVLDSYGIKKIEPGDCAGLYGQKPADKNMSKPPGQWQTYDITFRAARFEDGKKVKPATVTVIWNGEKVHDNVELKGPSGGGDKESAEPGGIRLQDHGNPVKYRNIWIVPLKDGGPEKTASAAGDARKN
jgi:Domain of Unknown Function (DUF1080)